MLEAQCIAEGSINRFSPAASESGVDLECALVGWHATWMTGSWRGGSKKVQRPLATSAVVLPRPFFLFFFFQIPSCIHWRWAGALTFIREAVRCIDYKRGPSAGTLCDVTSSGCPWPTSCGYCGLVRCIVLNQTMQEMCMSFKMFLVFFQPFQDWLTPISRLVACFHLWTNTVHRHQTIFAILLWDSKHLISLKE